MPTRIPGISAFYHDGAAALTEDGRIVAAVQEERFSRHKQTPASRWRIARLLGRPQQSLDELGHRTPLGFFATRGALGVDPVHL